MRTIKKTLIQKSSQNQGVRSWKQDTSIKKIETTTKNYKNDKIIKKNEQEKNISTRINFLNS